MAEPIVSKLPIEVELVVDVMPCLSMRQTYDSASEPHPCAYFGEWGYYHSYDYASAGPPEQPKIDLPVVYAGKRQVVPELLSGCRKAPIMCVGINPNLPGWTSRTRNAIHPYFEDILQYAHYFRYRTRDKLRVPQQDYEELRGSVDDDPSSPRALTEVGADIPVEPSPVLMYGQYQRLLDGLAQRKGWAQHQLAVGEDIAYANMVACPSARWVISPNQDDPAMPVMGRPRAQGIVGECFVERRYFLRQLVQSLPAVILVFSQTTAREFISALANRFTVGDPQPNEPLRDLFDREIRLSYGQLSDGTELDSRVIFMAHASANPHDFDAMVSRCVDYLVGEVDRGNLMYRNETGHLQRGRGSCVFCSNSLYRIGNCDYQAELQPIAPGGIEPLVADEPEALVDKSEQLHLLDQIMGSPAERRAGEVPRVAPLAGQPAGSRFILHGTVVPMNGAPIPNGAIYVADGRIAAVGEAGAPAPAGFDGVRTVQTKGMIYPGLFDMHNHLPYNILPLWRPPRRFDNRAGWLGLPEYSQHIGEPMNVIVGSGVNAIKAIIRYVEVKLLLGGVTSAQGLRSRFGGNALYRGVVRNVEAPDDPSLEPPADSRVIDIDNQTVANLKQDLDSGTKVFFHLAEGIDARAREQFRLAHENSAVRANLVGIHSLGLKAKDHQAMRSAESWVVWSPLSNSLLYGETIDPRVLFEKKSLFTLGSDWTPSGSRNILMELKVAWLRVQQVTPAAERFGFEDLAKAVTVSGAAAAGWEDQLGTIEAGKLADFVVLDATHEDPYENLVRATEREVRLVVVGGVPRYGDHDVMQAAGISAASAERLVVGGRKKRLHLHQDDSPLAGLTFDAARERLRAAMSDLDAVRNAPAPIFEPLGNEPQIDLELDMQPEDVADLGPMPLAVLPPLPKLSLDAPTVVDDKTYFDHLESFEPLPEYFKGADGLRGFYQSGL
ncbi:cytosine/adenosine deaminase-related metal-dependent hydrolase [Mycobacterium sp. BK086]|nr:cytosine/adenosine deaminase-related metal-dependent hydrolase [Mycobacterium sp. BK086]